MLQGSVKRKGRGFTLSGVAQRTAGRRRGLHATHGALAD